MTKIVQIATEIADRYCRDCRDCWDCREYRYCQDCGHLRECIPRLLWLPILAAEYGTWRAEIEKLKRLPAGIAGTAEITAQKCRGCLEWGDCRDCDGDCRDCRVCWDSRECRYCQHWRDRSHCRVMLPTLPGLTILLKLSPENMRWQDQIEKIARMPAGIAGTAEIVGQDCRDFRWCFGCPDCRFCWARLLRVQRRLLTEFAEYQDCRNCTPSLRRRLPGDIAERTKFSEATEIVDLGKIADIAESKAWECWACRFAEIAGVAENSDIAKIAESVAWEGQDQGYCRDCRLSVGDWMMKFKRLRDCRPGMPGQQRLPTSAKAPRSPKVSPEIADLVDIAEIANLAENDSQECRECTDCRPRQRCPPHQVCGLRLLISRFCWDCQYFRDCRQTLQRFPRLLWLPALVIAGQKCWECRVCRICSPSLRLRLPVGIAGNADIAGQECQDFSGCWECPDRRFCRPELPRLRRRLPAALAESTEVAKTTEIADLGMIADIAESKAWECWACRYCRVCKRDCRQCDGICRPILLGLPTMQILARSPRPPRVYPQIAGITDIGGQEWDIACRYWKYWPDCRPEWPGLPTLPRLPGVPRLPRLPKSPRVWPNNAKLVDTVENADIAEIRDRDCDGDCAPRSPADIVKIAEIAKSVSRDCQDYRYCRSRMGDCILRLKNWPDCRPVLPALQRLRPKKAEVAGVAESANIAEFAVRDCDGDCRGCRICWYCRECRYCQYWPDRPECRVGLPILPGLTILLKLPAENGRLHDEIEKISRLPAGTAEIAGQECRDFRWCFECPDCWFCRLRVLSLLRRMPAEGTAIAEFAHGFCDGDCHPTLPRVPNLPRPLRLPTLAGVPISPRVGPENVEHVDIAEIAGIAENADIAKIAETAESISPDC